MSHILCGAVEWGALGTAFLLGVYTMLMFLLFARGAHPFTPAGRATLRWRREKGRRAAAFINAGMAPVSAYAKAHAEMQSESRAVERALDE